MRRQKRQVLRVALQTGAATLAAYLLIDRIAPAHLSWGIISVLFTIGVSSDLTYRNAMGRIAGATIGAFVGLVATYALGGPVILGLIPAVVVTNMIVTVRPSLRYATVTTAILSLQPMPELADTIGRMVAIFTGTIIGAAAGFLVWPMRSRRRVELALRDALDDCRELLALIDQGVTTDEHDARDAVHSRFLGHLEAARARVRETRFSSRLRSGAGLRDAVRGVEALWHALIVLDRAVREERREISQDTLE
ncbi:FUSC family protein, partial [uncultured Jannaschia sp.]|uniref:FUSC family protein n=1 Tax=uncultured Jannaschia sp. TaxID=293347 RepID=UPI002623409F